MTNLISPLLWQSVPFEDPDAWDDFLGHHEVWHKILAERTGTRWQPLDDLRDNLDAHEDLHAILSAAANVPAVGDLSSYDLNDHDSFLAWHFLHAADHQRLREALNL